MRLRVRSFWALAAHVLRLVVVAAVGSRLDQVPTREPTAMTDDPETGTPQVAPVLTVNTPKHDQIPGQAALVNGTIALRKTHPNLWRLLMTYATLNVALGGNFIFLHPTFPIYGASNYVWGGIFLGLGLAKLTFLNVVRNLTAVRAAMGCEVAYMLFIAAGATQPFSEGVGSLQNPILYLSLAALEFPLLLEPFIQPLTARRD